MKKNTSVLLMPAIGALALLGLTTGGCTPEARKDVSEAGQNVGQAAEKSVEGTAEATAKAGEAVATGAGKVADEAGQAVQSGATAVAQGTEKAVEATATGAKKAGQAVSKGAEMVAEDASKKVESGAKELNDAAQVVSLTPKVKNALYADPKISGYKLDVDTSGEKDTVTITGTAPTQAEKARISKVAKQAAGANIKVVNNVTVGKAAAH